MGTLGDILETMGRGQKRCGPKKGPRPKDLRRYGRQQEYRDGDERGNGGRRGWKGRLRRGKATREGRDEGG